MLKTIKTPRRIFTMFLVSVPRTSSWSLRGRWWFLRGVLMVLILWMSFIYITEATYQFSDLYLQGKLSNSWVLQSVIQVSSLESKRMLGVLRGVLVVFFYIMDVFYIYQ
jgi:hypothetical protein